MLKPHDLFARYYPVTSSSTEKSSSKNIINLLNKTARAASSLAATHTPCNVRYFFPSKVDGIIVFEVRIRRWVVSLLQLLQVRLRPGLPLLIQLQQTLRTEPKSSSFSQTLLSFPRRLSVCAPWHRLHHFLTASVVCYLQADFLSFLLFFNLRHVHLLQRCATSCRAPVVSVEVVRCSDEQMGTPQPL